MPSLRDRPASPLAFLLEAYNTRAPSLFLITGPSGAGKTSWCESVVDFARERSWPVSGLLSPAIMEGARKVAIDLLDLRSGERRRLATRVALPIPGIQGTEEDPVAGIVTGSWRFDPATIAWGNGVLSKTTAADLLIVDELGPLEFRQVQGLQAALRLLDTWCYRLACVTVRPSLVGAARMRWPWSQIVALGDESDD